MSFYSPGVFDWSYFSRGLLALGLSATWRMIGVLRGPKCD